MTSIKVLSLFSGAGGLDLGLERAGMEVVALCEIDPKAKMVLRKHWPDLTIYNDVREVTRERLIADGIEHPDIVAGGSPCQDLSVAGRRKGLDGSRSGLFWEQCRIADELGADIFWENVPGALSSNNGADFAAVLWGVTGALVELSPKQKWAKSGVLVGPKRTAIWRVADAQRFGVPQRRRRVYVVGCSGAVARRLAPLLLELQGGAGDHQAGRETGTRSSGASQDRSDEAGGDRAAGDPRSWVKSKRASSDTDDDSWREQPVSPTLNAFDNGGDSRATVLTVHDGAMPFTETGFANYGPGVGTLRANGGTLQGGSETLVVAPDPANIHNVETVGALTVSDLVKGQGNYQSVGNNLLQVQSTEPEIASCLRSGGDGGVPSSRGENLVVQDDQPDTIGFSHTQGLDHQASTEHFPTLRAEGGGHAIMHPIAFTQNQREEVRDLGTLSSAISASGGSHQQTYLIVPASEEG